MSEIVKKVVYVEVSGEMEWVGLYVDGFLVAQGSSINLPTYLTGLIIFTHRHSNPRDEMVVREFLGFPEMLSELDSFGA